MSAKHCGRSGSRRWPTCPAGIPAHLQVLGSLLPVTPSSVGRESWSHSDLRKEMQLSPPRRGVGEGTDQGRGWREAVPAWNPGWTAAGKESTEDRLAPLGGHRAEREGGREGERAQVDTTWSAPWTDWAVPKRKDISG